MGQALELGELRVTQAFRVRTRDEEFAVVPHVRMIPDVFAHLASSWKRNPNNIDRKLRHCSLAAIEHCNAVC